jgi:hypothetical protein
MATKRFVATWCMMSSMMDAIKSRLVAGGHLTEPNTESVYYSVVSL